VVTARIECAFGAAVLNDLEGRAAAVARARRVPPRLTPWLRRMAWPGFWTAAVVGLFLLAWHEARQMAVQSDGASISLQAWQVLHGNLLLRGWHTADVSFYTTEFPVYLLVEAVRGLRPDVVTISAAVDYTLLVAGAAFVAKGAAGGREGLVRALLAAGIMLAPSAAAATWLLNDPDHAATAIWVLLVLLVIDRCGRRWYVPVLAWAVLAWAIVGDPLVEVIGAAPLALVGLVRACQGLVQRREPLRSRWYELSLAAAAVVSVVAAAAATHVIRALGGWVPSQGVAGFVSSSRLPANLAATFEDFLGLFSADFFGAKIGVGLLPVAIHLAGACLVALGLRLAVRRFLRGGDLVAGVLVAAVILDLAAYVFLFPAKPSDIREVAPVFALGAALAGRVLGAPLVRNRLEPLLAAGLACYLLTLGPAILAKPRPPANLALTAWLESHHLESGIAGYWQVNSVVLDSGTKITMRPVEASGTGETLVPYPWELDARLLEASTNYANFVVVKAPGTSGGQSVTEGRAIATFGKPAHVYRYQQYRILVWDKNLLSLLPPLPPGG
jgi:hypothetical protein